MREIERATGTRKGSQLLNQAIRDLQAEAAELRALFGEVTTAVARLQLHQADLQMERTLENYRRKRDALAAIGR
jgi:hypothetical protein